MGFDNTSLRIHCWLKSQGNSFDKVATLGRQTIYGITKDSFIRIANKFQLPLKDSQATEILNGSDGYADGIYRWLGATSVDSFDYSSYEKAEKSDLNGSWKPCRGNMILYSTEEL